MDALFEATDLVPCGSQPSGSGRHSGKMMNPLPQPEREPNPELSPKAGIKKKKHKVAREEDPDAAGPSKKAGRKKRKYRLNAAALEEAWAHEGVEFDDEGPDADRFQNYAKIRRAAQDRHSVLKNPWRAAIAKGKAKAGKGTSQADAKAAAPNDEELAAFRGLLAAKQQSQRPPKEDDEPELVGEEACISLPALTKMFDGKKHSLWTVHESNPAEICHPTVYLDTDGKELVFPGRNGDYRAIVADYAQANMLMGFFMGKECDSVIDSLKTVGGITTLENATRPTLHLLLLAGMMHVLGAGKLYRRWIFYHGGDHKKVFFTSPAAMKVGPGWASGATPEENLMNVRKALWAWAFGPDEELPSDEEMEAMGGAPTDEEMYALAVKMWGLPQ